MGENCFGEVFVTDIVKKLKMYDEDGESVYSKGKILEIENKTRENWQVVPHLFINGLLQSDQ